MIWSDTCKECSGSGGTSKRPDGYHGDRLMWTCPTCKGARHMGLQVAVPAEHDGATGYMRFLTVEEVEELKGKLPSIFESLIKGDVIQFVYKGQPVKLMPHRKEEG